MKTQSEGLYKEKGSKFIAYAVACYDEANAKVILDQWRKEHFQARHVCYAYRFGLDQFKFRMNDDGEPANSAGAPIYGQIQSFGLTNILIGVVRYFGGTKLGVGGLIHAYKMASKDAVENGEIIELELFEWVKLQFNYALMPQVMKVIKNHQLAIVQPDFELSCSLVVKLPLVRQFQIKEELSHLGEISITSQGIY
jgi:uncharacterized YigZ family protein